MCALRELAVLLIVITTVFTEANPTPSTTNVAQGNQDEDFSPWLNFPSFDNFNNFFRNPFSNFNDGSQFPDFKFSAPRFPKFENNGPKITDNDDKLQVVIQAKGYEQSDIKVQVKGGLIIVKGQRVNQKDEQNLSAKRFSYSYTLPTQTSAAKVTAKLTSDGYVIIEAPKDGSSDQASNASDTEVPVTLAETAYKKEN